MISRELQKSNHICDVLCTGTLFKRFPNTFKHLFNWLTVLKVRPDVVVIQRTSNFIDYYMSKIAKKYSKLIFDYDDAIFHVRMPGKIISYSHLDKLLSSVDFVFAGSHYLESYAQRFNKNIFLLPTPADIDLYSPKSSFKEFKDEVVIGWLGGGTKYQLRYLSILIKPLLALSSCYNIKLKLISALDKEVRDEFGSLGFKVDFGLDHWVPSSEIPSLVSDFDIGVMPLLDEPFAKGKCAMKALEYMSLGIPVVASAVGENNYVIKNGVNGFLASNDDEWIKCLEILILDENLRKNMGITGRKMVEETYSVKVVADKMAKIIDGLL